MKILINSGTEVTARDSDEAMALPLAAQNEHKTVVCVLFENRSDINATNRYQETPIFGAVRNGHEGVVRLLLDKEPDIRARSKKGTTALHEGYIDQLK